MKADLFQARHHETWDTRRLATLAALGIDRFHVELASRDQPAGLIRQLRRRFTTEVLPAVRDALAS